MTNREENLKKLNDELEKLSDEELDNVAGGVVATTQSDMEALTLTPTGPKTASFNANSQGRLEQLRTYGGMKH